MNPQMMQLALQFLANRDKPPVGVDRKTDPYGGVTAANMLGGVGSDPGSGVGAPPIADLSAAQPPTLAPGFGQSGGAYNPSTFGQGGYQGFTPQFMSGQPTGNQSGQLAGQYPPERLAEHAQGDSLYNTAFDSSEAAYLAQNPAMPEPLASKLFPGYNTASGPVMESASRQVPEFNAPGAQPALVSDSPMQPGAQPTLQEITNPLGAIDPNLGPVSNVPPQVQPQVQTQQPEYENPQFLADATSPIPINPQVVPEPPFDKSQVPYKGMAQVIPEGGLPYDPKTLNPAYTSSLPGTAITQAAGPGGPPLTAEDWAGEGATTTPPGQLNLDPMQPGGGIPSATGTYTPLGVPPTGDKQQAMDAIISGAQQAGMTPEKQAAETARQLAAQKQVQASQFDPGKALAQIKQEAKDLKPGEAQAIKDQFAAGSLKVEDMSDVEKSVTGAKLPMEIELPKGGFAIEKTPGYEDPGGLKEQAKKAQAADVADKKKDVEGKKKLDLEAEKISKEVKAKTAMQEATKKAQRVGGERVARKERDKAIAAKVKAKADKKQAAIDELASGVQKAKAMKIEAGDIESDKPIGEVLAEGPSTEKNKRAAEGGTYFDEETGKYVMGKKTIEVEAKVGNKKLAAKLNLESPKDAALVKAIGKVPKKEKGKIGKALSKIYDVMDKNLRDPRVTAAMLGAAKGIDPKGFGGQVADAAMPWVQEQIKVNAADAYGKAQGKIYNDYISHVLQGKDPATFEGNMTPAHISEATKDAMKVATFGLAVTTTPTVTQQLMSKLILADKNNDAAYQRTLMTVMGQMTATRNKMKNAKDTKELAEHYKVIGKITSAIEPAQMNLLFGEIKREDYTDDAKYDAAKAAKEDQMISFLQGEKGSVITPQMKLAAVNAYDFINKHGGTSILDERVISQWRSDTQSDYGIKATDVTDDTSFKSWSKSAGFTYTTEGEGADKVYIASNGTRYKIIDGKLKKAK